MTVCLAKEPQNLFVFTNQTASGKNASLPPAPEIQEALYGGQFNPSHLNNFSSLFEPGASRAASELQAAAVQPGEPLVDADNRLNVLAQGVRYRPAGCQEAACAAAYSGDQPVQMDVWTLRFRLRSGLTWSDGAALTASDSLYTYELAQALRPGAYIELLAHTRAYTAPDDHTLEWQGLPGYLDASAENKFFPPLPRHAWDKLAPADISLGPQQLAQLPTYGEFQLDSWTPGSQLVLKRNPNAVRAAESPAPHIDLLVFRWVELGEPALQALSGGQCDLLDASLVPESLYAQYVQLSQAGKLHLAVEPAAWEALFFNLQPLDPKQLNLLGLPALRRAVALCSQRQSLAAQVLGGLAAPANSLTFSSPAADPYPASPAAGSDLLASAGWVDGDQNPATPRTSLGVAGLPDGTPLSLTLLASPDPDRQATAAALRQNLAACGLEVKVETRPAQDYLAAGPEGPVFGRTFSLALFAWSAPNGSLPCSLFTSLEAPAPYPQGALDWGGANAAGYASPAYDQACQAALYSLPGSDAQKQGAQQVEKIFWEDLPALPLYWRPLVFAARPDLCGLNGDDTRSNFLYFDIGAGCNQP